MLIIISDQFGRLASQTFVTCVCGRYNVTKGLLLTGFFGFIAVIVFGAMGDNRDWMPHWDHNHLSWSFGLGECKTYYLVLDSK